MSGTDPESFYFSPFASIETLDSCFRRNDGFVACFHIMRIENFISDCKERSRSVPTVKGKSFSKQLELIGRWSGKGVGNGIVPFELMKAFFAKGQLE